MRERKPFITGSRVYGTPRDNSDLDVVIRCDAYVIAAIEALIGKSSGDYDHKSVSVQCGPLNLHLCGTDGEYDRWHQGTRTCEVVAPIDRKTAIKMLRVAGIDRGSENVRGKYHTRGPGNVDILREDGTLTPYRQWMGYEKPNKKSA
jgi:hypothetical protein